MKPKSISLFILLMVIGCSRAAASLGMDEYEVKPGQRLDVDLESGGSIYIEGWDRNTVAIDVQISPKDREYYDVEVYQKRTGLEITSSYRNRWRHHHSDLRLSVKVPSRFDLKIKTMGGSVRIEGVEGIFEGKSMGGDLDLSGLKGEVDLETMGGDILLTDSHLEGRVHTMGGDVTLDNVAGGVKGSTMGGDVIYRNRSGETTSDAIRITTMGGDIELDEAPAGVTVKTMGGDIHIRSAERFVEAKTMGGDIVIDAIDGGLRATTMGGDVEVTMVGDPSKGERDVKITSKGGDVTLTVPDGLSMDIDITLAYTKRGHQRYEIISDFDLQIDESEDWEYWHGSPRKYIYGKGKIAGGDHKILIETVNGDVILRKD